MRNAGVDEVTGRERSQKGSKAHPQRSPGQNRKLRSPGVPRWCWVLVTARVRLCCQRRAEAWQRVRCCCTPAGYSSSCDPFNGTTTSLDFGASQGHDASAPPPPPRLHPPEASSISPQGRFQPARHSTPRRFSDGSSTPARACSIAKQSTSRGSAYLSSVATTKA